MSAIPLSHDLSSGPVPVRKQLPRNWQALLLYFMRQMPWLCIGFAIFACAPRFFDVLLVYATKNIIDSVLQAQTAGASDVVDVASGPMVFFILTIFMRFGADLIVWAFSYNTKFQLLQNMRREIFAYVQRHGTTYFDTELSGRVAHKTVLIPEQLVLILERFVFDFIPATVFFFVIAAFFFAQNPAFAFAVLVYIVIYFMICLYHGKRIGPIAQERNAASTHVTGRVADVITNIKNVIFMGAQTFEDDNVGLYVSVEKRNRQAVYRAIVRLRLVQRALDITMWIGLFVGAIYAWSHGYITVGGFVMITTLASMLLKTAYDVGQIFPDFFDVMGSAQDGIDTILVPHAMQDKPNARTLRVTKGEIRFENLNFGYGNDRPILKDLTLVIPPGQRVGLIGSSGAGKTTLTSLLLRLHDLKSGRIMIDGQDIADVTQESLRRQIGLIPQDTVLFHRTLMDNIRYGRHDATDADVMDAGKRAYAEDFITDMPQGYRTMVGERGIRLSGGQRQRIVIARALLKDAPILVLDEATSALDSESEAVIHQAMNDAMQGRTVIAIAHRLSTISHLDRLIILKDGQIVEDGSHAELLAANGYYARLWNKQSGGFLTLE
jgi:ATP-binding cassette, subfamily B, bacterial